MLAGYKNNRMKPPGSLKTVLDGLLASYGLAHNLGGWRVVVDWPDIAGEKIAEVSRAVRFEDETLLVSVPDSAWRQELIMETDRILEKIHGLPGGRAVKKIRFIS
jgi:predicted nucleic acid-binding Zn ribbon protein